MGRSFSAATGVAFALALGVFGAASASAQENVMKACGDKWQAAKTAGTTGGKTWPEYLAACRADMAAAKPAAPAKPAAAPSATAGAGSGKPAVFPDAIASKFANEKPARARQKTCGEQFKANKATDSNGGLKWIEKGGGYWSQCNTRLKATRA